MGEITIHLPQDIDTSVDNLVSRGIYKAKEEAIIALIRRGLGAMKKREGPGVHIIPQDYPPHPPFKPPEKWPDHYEFKK